MTNQGRKQALARNQRVVPSIGDADRNRPMTLKLADVESMCDGLDVIKEDFDEESFKKILLVVREFFGSRCAGSGKYFKERYGLTVVDSYYDRGTKGAYDRRRRK